MITDKYPSYSEMELNESQNFKIDYRTGNPDIAIIAIHGGEIEPLTSEIVKSIALEDYNYYIFEGDKGDGLDEDLHITSTRFNAEECMDIVSDSKITLSIHGCADKESLIYIGGTDERLKLIIKSVIDREFNSKYKDFVSTIITDKKHKFSGINPKNIVNKNKRNSGVQLEFSQGFRKKIISSLKRNREYININALYYFGRVINKAIKNYIKIIK